MLAKQYSVSVHGIHSIDIEIEVDIKPSLPSFVIVGLPDTAVKESKDRVKSAIQNSGFKYPQGRVTDHRINLTLHKLPLILEGDLDLLLDPLIAEFQAERLKQELS